MDKVMGQMDDVDAAGGMQLTWSECNSLPGCRSFGMSERGKE